MYTYVSHHISVTVEPSFMEDQSIPDENHFVWSYQVWIENKGDLSIQLKEREWHIYDGLGQRHEVSGEGVVGEQPIIHPGDSFSYTSGVPLHTPTGMMMGHYTVVDEEGESQKIIIPTFSLDSPYQKLCFH